MYGEDIDIKRYTNNGIKVIIENIGTKIQSSIIRDYQFEQDDPRNKYCPKNVSFKNTNQ